MARHVTLCLLTALLALPACAQSGDLVSNGDFSAGIEGWRVTDDTTCRPSVVEVTAGEHRRALRLVLDPVEGADPWAITLMQSLDAFTEEGDRLQFRAWLRSPEGCTVAGLVEIGRAPHTKSVYQTVDLTDEWKQYEFTGRCTEAFSPGGAQLGFHLGFDRGGVELTGLELVNLDATPETEGGRPTVETPQDLITNGGFSVPWEQRWSVNGGDRVKVSVVDSGLEGYARAARLECDPEPGAPPWALGIGQRCQGYVRRGDAVYFRAWMRSPHGCRVTFVYEKASEPHTKSISQTVKLTPQWQEYRFVGRPEEGYRPDESQAKWFLPDRGLVEVTGVQVQNFGVARDHSFDETIDYWAGREHPDTWRQAALERIEALRKGDLVVQVVDAEGRPVPGARVRVEQRSHLFRFGTAAPAGRLAGSDSPDNRRFREEVKRLFNTVTFENDLKWAAAGPARLETVDLAAAWLAEHGIAVRGHCLLWGSYRHIAGPASELRGDELLAACRAHVDDYVRRMRGRLYLWDVVNEAGSNTEVWDEVGWEAFADAFHWAREADPEALLCYNDYGIVNESPAYRAGVAARIRYLLQRGAPVDVLGIQGHMSVPLTPIHRVLEILDEWAAFGLPLEITEFDLGCRDDAVHAEYVRDFMIAAFSHLAVQGFIQWGFWEGSHWRAKDGAAMFRQDWSKRPAQEAYEDLVLNRWWTRWEGRTDDGGSARLRAFRGEHEVTAEVDGKAATARVTMGADDEAPVRLQVE